MKSVMYQRIWSRWRLQSRLLIIMMVLGQVSSALANTSQALTVVKGDHHETLQLNEIESLGVQQVTMRHPEGPQGTFSGVWLNTLLENQGLDEAKRVRFIAEDGYTTFLTPEERRHKDYLLVTRLDGQPVKQKDLGPYMLIVPDDAEAALDGAVSISHWIWAVRKIQAR